MRRFESFPVSEDDGPEEYRQEQERGRQAGDVLGRPAAVDQNAGGGAGKGHDDDGEAELGGEDSTAELVVGVELQKRRGAHPGDGAAHVRDDDGEAGDGHGGGLAQKEVSERSHNEADQDGVALAGLIAAGDVAEQDRAGERANATGAHQQADAEGGGTFGRGTEPVDGELVAAQDRQQHPVGGDDGVAGFDEQSGQHTGVAADVAHSFENRFEIVEIPPVQGSMAFDVGFVELHPANDQSRSDE